MKSVPLSRRRAIQTLFCSSAALALNICPDRANAEIAKEALHLLTIGFVVLQSWLGQTCPLTLWESALRVQAGGQGYQRGLIEDWVGRCLFYNAPPAVFVLIYSGFAALVIWTWWRWPPVAWSWVR